MEWSGVQWNGIEWKRKYQNISHVVRLLFVETCTIGEARIWLSKVKNKKQTNKNTLF